MNKTGKNKHEIGESLCFGCKKAVCGCSWSKYFKPVDGWNAEKVKLNISKEKTINTYQVKACPLFESDNVLSMYELYTIIADKIKCCYKTVILNMQTDKGISKLTKKLKAVNALYLLEDLAKARARKIGGKANG